MKVFVGKSLALADWIAVKLTGQAIAELPSNPKLRYGLALHQLAIEHATSIVVLVCHENYGSALSLLCPLRDAHLRGMWLQHTASPEQFDNAQKNDKFPDMKKLTEPFLVAPRREMTPEALAILDDYNHGGFRLLRARMGESGLDGSHTRLQIVGALLIADSFGLSAAANIAYATMYEWDGEGLN